MSILAKFPKTDICLIGISAGMIVGGTVGLTAALVRLLYRLTTT
jgi:hypothetical protein